MSSPPQVATKAASAAWNELAGIVGSEHFRPAAPADNVDGVQPQMIAEPATPEELARVLRTADHAGVTVVPRGGGSKLGWGNPPKRADLLLSTRRLNQVQEHAWADMTATIEAGCTVADFQRRLAEHGQRLALDPLWPERATIGGILATNDSGSLRVRFGSLRDLIIGITVALPDGTLAKSGGKVVKNVAGYDLPKLITGSLGTLAVITQAIFRLHPLPKNYRSVTFTGASREALNQLLLAILDSQMAFTGLQFRAGPAEAQLDIRFAGTEAGIEAQVQQARKLAAGTREAGSPAECWASAQALWDASGESVVAKFSVLPAHLNKVCAFADASSLSWRLVAQAVGVGWLRLEGTTDALVSGITSIRAELAKIGGSLVCYGCPTALKSRLDAWGQFGDAQHLMRRVKAQFDPSGTLNPGRFVGGI